MQHAEEDRLHIVSFPTNRIVTNATTRQQLQDFQRITFGFSWKLLSLTLIKLSRISKICFRRSAGVRLRKNNHTAHTLCIKVSLSERPEAQHQSGIWISGYNWLQPMGDAGMILSLIRSE